MKEFSIGARAIFGKDALKHLTEYKNSNVTIVTDPILRENGVCDAVKSYLSGCNVNIYWEIAPDPTFTQVAKTFEFVKSTNSTIIVALGGGSAIDTAKAVVLVDQRSNPDSKIKLIAIPTTAGTGSEVTNYTVIKDETTGRKIPIMDKCMEADVAILDYTLTKSVPAPVTAVTGMDVITHALEAYVAKEANPMTDAFAEKALKLAFANLYPAFLDGNNDEARENMMMASYLAGLAFNGAGLGICHSIAHNLGGEFHIPHGKANAIALPFVVAYNSDLDVPFGTDKSEIAKKYAKVAEIIGLPTGGVRLSVQNLVNEIKSLNIKMGIPASLLSMGISVSQFGDVQPNMIQNIFTDSCLPFNPKKINEKELKVLLDKIFRG